MDRCGLLISSFATLLYTNTLDADFVYDDSRAIVRNPDVLGTSPITNLFRDDFWGLPLGSAGSHGSYRPLTVFTFRLTVLLVGDVRPGWFHGVNAVLHGIATWLVFLLAQKLLPRKWSAGAALLFAVHPAHCEAVAGIVGRADLLACVFTVATLLVFMRKDSISIKGKLGIRKESKVARVLSFGCVWILSTASTLSKETGISALVICGVYEILIQLRNLRKQRSLRISNLVILTLSFGTLLIGRIWLLGGHIPKFAVADNPTAHCPHWLTRTLTFLHLPVINLGLLLWPSELSFDWSMDAVPRIYSVRDSRNINTIITLGGTLLLTTRSLCNLLRRNRSGNSESVLLTVALTVLPFLPASNLFFYVGFVVAERVLYLPSVGFCLLVTLGARGLAFGGGRWRRYVVIGGFVIVIASMTARTLKRNRDWVDEESLYRAGISVNPPKAYGNLGSVLSSNGRLAEAEIAFNMALKYRPNMADVHYNLGNLLLTENRLDAAVRSYRQAIFYRPSLAQAHLQLGKAHLAAGKTALAAISLWHCAALPAGDVRDPVAHRSASTSALFLLTQLLTTKAEKGEVTTSEDKTHHETYVRDSSKIEQKKNRTRVESEISESDQKNSSVQRTQPDPLQYWTSGSEKGNKSLCAAPEWQRVRRLS